MLNVRNITLLGLIHSFAIYGVILIATNQPWQWKTIGFCYLSSVFSLLGVNAGVHRLWSHRSYKAKWPLKYFLLLMFSLAGQDSVWFWVACHRMHHKHSDTERDPHNSNRGFWFSHVGWILTIDRKQLEKDIKQYDMSDIENDWILAVNKKYYLMFDIVLGGMCTSFIPFYFWNETADASIAIGSCWRLFYVSHATYAINSFAHLWGYKPYDNSIPPAENKWVSWLGGGEGWHNFHHAFPWDYSQNEYGSRNMNFTTRFIDLCAWLGLAYDLKTVTLTHVERRIGRTGTKIETRTESACSKNCK